MDEQYEDEDNRPTPLLPPPYQGAMPCCKFFCTAIAEPGSTRCKPCRLETEVTYHDGSE